MLIRSQDKENLILLDNITYLQIIAKENGKYAIWVVCGYGDDFILALYSTMDKAKAVLDDIETSAVNYERAKASGTELFNYIMPADDDPWFDQQKIREKLVDYEDAEEQGRLIKFPVAIGQHVWELDNFGIITELTVHELSQLSDGGQSMLADSSGLRSYYSLNSIGKNIFLTREQAEKKRKELED